MLCGVGLCQVPAYIEDLGIHVVQGDVYHLLFNLGEWLDGRIWRKKDRLDVQRLLQLIHHVTGMPALSECLRDPWLGL